MNVFNKQQKRNKIILLLLFLISFILFCLMKREWQLKDSCLEYLLFILSYGLGTALMLGDEKYLQQIYAEEMNKKLLITRSPLFLLSLALLSIFILTSTGSIAGAGLILALNIVICIEIWQLAPKIDIFNHYFMNAGEKQLNLSEIKIIKIAVSIYFLLLLFLFR